MPSATRRKLATILPHVTWGVADQALLSASNFVVGVWLSRLFSIRDYGAYGIAFSAYLLVLGIHAGLIQEPLSIDAHRQNDRSAFLNAQAVLTVAFAAISMAALALVAIVLNALEQTAVARALLSLAVAMPLLLGQQHQRRALYVIDRPRDAAAAATAYSVVTIGTLALMDHYGVTEVLALFLPLGIGAGAALAMGVILRGDGALSGRRVTLSRVRDAARGNWQYGRWAGSSSVVYWLSSYAYAPMVGALVGLSGAGAARAMTNLTMPLNQLVTAVGVALLPMMARSAHGDRRRPDGRGLLLAAVLGGVGIAYLLLMVLVGRWVIDAVYPGGEYSTFYPLLIMLCAAQAMAAFRQGLYTGLRAAHRPKIIMLGQAVGAGVTLTLGVELVRALGTTGMGWGQIVSTVLEIAVLLLSGWLLIRPGNVVVEVGEAEDAG